jgi:galactoside O-acetyltransferase
MSTANDFMTPDELSQLGLASCGANVQISRHALILRPEKLSIGDHSRIDAFCVISPGDDGIWIGRHCHISTHVVILGRAQIRIDDLVGISVGSRVLSSTDDFSGDYLTGPSIPEHLRRVISAPIAIGRYSVLGANTVVLPGVTIGESAASGAGALIDADVAPLTIVGGVPARVLKQRAARHRDLAAEVD